MASNQTPLISISAFDTTTSTKAVPTQPPPTTTTSPSATSSSTTTTTTNDISTTAISGQQPEAAIQIVLPTTTTVPVASTPPSRGAKKVTTPPPVSIPQQSTSTSGAANPPTQKRPMNAFLIFCKRHRSGVREKYPHMENRQITKILGELWANLSAETKHDYTDLARLNKEAFMRANPNFKWYKTDANVLQKAPAAAAPAPAPVPVSAPAVSIQVSSQAPIITTSMAPIIYTVPSSTQSVVTVSGSATIPAFSQPISIVQASPARVSSPAMGPQQVTVTVALPPGVLQQPQNGQNISIVESVVVNTLNKYNNSPLSLTTSAGENISQGSSNDNNTSGGTPNVTAAATPTSASVTPKKSGYIHPKKKWMGENETSETMSKFLFLYIFLFYF